MCYQLTKGFAACRHPDPEATPTAIQHCLEYISQGTCSMGVSTIFSDKVTNKIDFCSECQDLRERFMVSTGSLEGEHQFSDTWKLYAQIGWEFHDFMFIPTAFFAQFALDLEIGSYRGKDQDKLTSVIMKRVVCFEAFKEWLAGRLHKRDSAGKPYFPTNTQSALIKKKRLQYLVLWMVESLVNKRFDKFELDKPTLKQCLTRAFNGLVYDWENEFPVEPGVDKAKKKLEAYWNKWASKVMGTSK